MCRTAWKTRDSIRESNLNLLWNLTLGTDEFRTFVLSCTVYDATAKHFTGRNARSGNSSSWSESRCGHFPFGAGPVKGRRANYVPECVALYVSFVCISQECRPEQRERNFDGPLLVNGKEKEAIDEFTHKKFTSTERKSIRRETFSADTRKDTWNGLGGNRTRRRRFVLSTVTNSCSFDFSYFFRPQRKSN